MTTRYDEEIREVETRLMRERAAVSVEAERLKMAVRATVYRKAVSPKGMMTALAAGFLFAELTAPRRRRRVREKTVIEEPTSTAATATKAVGIGGLLGSAAMRFIRARYGSPWVLARRALHYYAQQRRAQRAAEEDAAYTHGAAGAWPAGRSGATASMRSASAATPTPGVDVPPSSSGATASRPRMPGHETHVPS